MELYVVEVNAGTLYNLTVPILFNQHGHQRIMGDRALVRYLARTYLE